MSLRVGKPDLGFGVPLIHTRLSFAIFASEKANEDLTREVSR
jgi:hypothetical protein